MVEGRICTKTNLHGRINFARRIIFTRGKTPLRVNFTRVKKLDGDTCAQLSVKNLMIEGKIGVRVRVIVEIRKNINSK